MMEKKGRKYARRVALREAAKTIKELSGGSGSMTFLILNNQFIHDGDKKLIRDEMFKLADSLDKRAARMY